MIEVILNSGKISVCLSVVLVVIAWVFFRPRKNYLPGPRPLPIIGNLHLLRKDVLKAFRELRFKYGDVFMLKFGNNKAVVVNGYENIKQLVVHQGDETSKRPNTFLVDVLFRGKGIVASSGSLWKIHRSFGMATLRELGFGNRGTEERIMEEVVIFLDELESKNGKPFNPHSIIRASVSNIICSFIFGRRFDYKDNRFHKLLAYFEETLDLLGRNSIIDSLPFLRFLPTDPFKGQLLIKYFETVRNFIKEIIAEHKQGYDEYCIKDYIDAFLKEMKDNRETFTEEQLIESVLQFFIAGTETTTTTLEWAILYFIHYPDVQNKMRKEIDDVIGMSRPPSLKDRRSLPYCEAVITEINRCSAIVPIAQLSCHQDISFKGFTIPKGAFILPNLHSILNDPDIFSNPEQFKPERFLDNSGNFYGYEKVVVFSMGRRICLGEALARSELFLYLTSMIQRFTFAATDENKLPSLDGSLGITFTPMPFEACVMKNN